MRKTKIFYFLLSIACLLSATCKKTAENNVFNDQSRIKGVIYYSNLSTGLSDTAKTAQITLTLGGKSATQVVLNLTNGMFDISSLSHGDYVMEITYDKAVPGSTKTTHYELSFPFSLVKNDTKLNFDQTLQNISTQTPTLQITVADANKAAINGAQVALYSDHDALVANRGTTAGSIKSGTTNADGIIVFDGLEAQKYYVAVFTPNLSNQADDSGGIVVKSAPDYTPDPITVTPIGISMQVIVTDAAGAVVPGAKICIYSDLTLLQTYRGQCTGSVTSGQTNNLGVFIFTGLQPIPYYMSVYTTVGSDSLTNKGPDETPITLVPNTLNTNRVTIVKKARVQTTSLLVSVTDNFGAAMVGTSVSIYSDPTLLATYRGSSTGSLQTGMTDGSGNYVFNNLQPSVTYYISAFKIDGTSILSNKANDTTDPVTVIANKQTTKNITIKP